MSRGKGRSTNVIAAGYRPVRCRVVIMCSCMLISLRPEIMEKSDAAVDAFPLSTTSSTPSSLPCKLPSGACCLKGVSHT